MIIEEKTLRTTLTIYGTQSTLLAKELELQKRIREAEEESTTFDGLCEKVWAIIGAFEMKLKRKGYTAVTLYENFIDNEEYVKLFLPPRSESLSNVCGIFMIVEVSHTISTFTITIADVPSSVDKIVHSFQLYAYNYIRLKSLK